MIFTAFDFEGFYTQHSDAVCCAKLDRLKNLRNREGKLSPSTRKGVIRKILYCFYVFEIAHGLIDLGQNPVLVRGLHGKDMESQLQFANSNCFLTTLIPALHASPAVVRSLATRLPAPENQLELRQSLLRHL